MLKSVIVLFLVLVSLFAETEYKTENTNITLYNSDVAYNYDRLRFRLDYKEESYFATVIADGVNYLGKSYIASDTFAYTQLLKSDTPFKTQTQFWDYKYGSAYAKLYRLYGGYEDDSNRVVLGLQNISMGVGRIWQPTNIYNPKNIYALEPDETFGVLGALYTRYLDETSHVTGIISLDRNNDPCAALRYQGFYDAADIALDLISSKNTKMAGYEIDGSLEESGIGLRSEGAYIDNNISTFFQGIIGADYGFEDGVTLVLEALYSSKIFTPLESLQNYNSEIAQNMVGSHYFAALSLTYDFNIYLNGSFVYIEGFDGDRNRFAVPQFTYTLNDYNSFSIAAMLYDTQSSDEVNLNRYYFRWDLAF